MSPLYILFCFPVILLQLPDFLHCLATGCLFNSKKPRTASEWCAYVVLMSQYWVQFPPFYWLTLRHVGMLLLYQVLILYSSVWPVDVNFILDTADLCRFRLALKTEFPATKANVSSCFNCEKPPKYVVLRSIWQSWENTQISNPSC